MLLQEQWQQQWQQLWIHRVSTNHKGEGEGEDEVHHHLEWVVHLEEEALFGGPCQEVQGPCQEVRGPWVDRQEARQACQGPREGPV